MSTHILNETDNGIRLMTAPTYDTALDGLKVYRVGGAVRDQLLGYPSTETDWVVVGATPNDLLARGFTQVGKDFPVFLHPKTHEEYALARTERKSGHGYHGFALNADPSVTLEQDLIRRDLTINAMAMNTEGELIDPYGGQRDLNEKRLRHVSQAFTEDPLRVLRVARFAARYHHLGFSVAQETGALMARIVAQGELAHLALERVWTETERALASANPEVYFNVLKDCNALPRLFPGIDAAAIDDLRRAARVTTTAPTRWAAMLARLELPVIDNLSGALKTPGVFANLSRQLATWRRTGNINQAESIYNALISTRALKQGDTFRHFLTALAALDGALPDDHQSAERFDRARHAAAGVSAQDFADSGLNGRGLGAAIHAKRLAAIEKVIDVNL